MREFIGAAPQQHRHGAMRTEVKFVDGKRRLFLATGLKSALTQDRMDRIVELIEGGCPPDAAAPATGISYHTYTGWMERGRNRQVRADGLEPTYIQFREAVEAALKICEQKLARKWMKLAAEGGTKTTVVTRRKVMDDGEVVTYVGEEKTETTDGDWRGIAEFLARRFPGWRKSEQVEVSGPDGKPIQTTVSPIPLDMLSTETKRRIVAELERGHDVSRLLSGDVIDAEVVDSDEFEVASMTDIL